MPVYVDDMGAQFGRMIMVHMIADTTEELLDMVDNIGVHRKWIQNPGTPHEHFDISKSKKQLAISRGAKPISWLQLSCMIHYRCEFNILPSPGKSVRWMRWRIRNRRLSRE